MALTVIGTMLSGPGIAAAGPQDTKKQAPKQQKKSDQSSSMRGCIDQKDGRYVLVDDHSLNRIADLEPDGFPVEGFAKHVGHKVIVRGTSIADGKQTLFKVRTIETVSETCAPENNQNQPL